MIVAALRLGAHGYLLKFDAADLPLTVDAILHDSIFLSSRLDGIARRSNGPQLSSKL